MMLTLRFDEALQFASRLHRGHARKGVDIPYISHLLAVCALVIEDGGGEDEAIAALLHDSIEDCGNAFPGGRDALRGEIEERFGRHVLDIVNACTDDDLYQGSESRKEDPGTWLPRKRAYLSHIPSLDPAARRVSCADKLHNAQSLLRDYRAVGGELWRRFRTGSGEDQLWYYAALVEAFRGSGRLADELERVVLELRRECR